jgi:single-strand DNA-binding protein
MNDTYITIVGNALTKPEKKVLEKSGTVVANFRVVSNARRKDPESGQWVDSSNLRIKVNCWRRLADHVVQSVNAGDPVIVYGRISTREWKTEQGEMRVNYEMDADNVGHDLRWGINSYTKMRYDLPNSVVEDAETDNRVNGEPTHLFSDPAVPIADETHAGGYDESYGSSVPMETAEDAMAILRGAGLGPIADDSALGDGGPGGSAGEEDDTGEEDLVGAASGLGGPAGRGRRRGR